MIILMIWLKISWFLHKTLFIQYYLKYSLFRFKNIMGKDKSANPMDKYRKMQKKKVNQ